MKLEKVISIEMYKGKLEETLRNALTTHNLYHYYNAEPCKTINQQSTDPK